MLLQEFVITVKSVLREISHSHKNIFVVEHQYDQLCDSNDRLKDEFGRHDRESGAPLSQDALHFGKKGLRLLAMSLKSSVMGKNKRQGGRGTAEPGHQADYQPT